MKCNICNKEANNIDRINLICRDCTEKLENKWDIVDRYFEIDENNFWTEIIKIINRNYPEQTKILKSNFYPDGYGFRFEYKEIL